MFSKAPSAPIYTYYKRAACAQKTRFFGKLFPKVSKNAFLACFFKILTAAQKVLPKQGLFNADWGSWENQFGRPLKKRSTKFQKLENFYISEYPPPREISRSTLDDSFLTISFPF